MYTTEIQIAYEEYCIDCYYEGKTPEPIWVWADCKEVEG